MATGRHLKEKVWKGNSTLIEENKIESFKLEEIMEEEDLMCRTHNLHSTQII